MDAGPASHRVRLWRGGSASKVLLHRLFFRRVRHHGHPKVCMARAEEDGGTAPLAVTGPSVTQCVVSLLPIFYCFSPKRCL